MEEVIRINGITKEYDGNVVVDDLSFSLQKGHILAFLGPNGAGKSTTINMISSLVGQDNGSILYKGEDIKKCMKRFKKEIGVVPQSLAIYEDLTAMQNLRFFAGLYGAKGSELNRICDDALEFVGLLSVKDKKAGTFSGGMKRRLNIACSLVNSPQVIILDEPTVGIDPQSRNFILESIKSLRDKGTSVIYTTHYMDEVESIADDVIIIDHGKVLINDTLENIRREYTEKAVAVFKSENIPDKLTEKIGNLSGVTVLEVTDDSVTIEYDHKLNENCINQVMTAFTETGSCVASVNTLKLDLEDIFLKLTGTKLRDQGG